MKERTFCVRRNALKAPDLTRALDATTTDPTFWESRLPELAPVKRRASGTNEHNRRETWTESETTGGRRDSLRAQTRARCDGDRFSRWTRSTLPRDAIAQDLDGGIPPPTISARLGRQIEPLRAVIILPFTCWAKLSAARRELVLL